MNKSGHSKSLERDAQKLVLFRTSQFQRYAELTML